jgi:hypothetical protein
MNTTLKQSLSMLAFCVSSVAAPGAEVTPSTYCNPLPIPNFPIGRLARPVTNGEPSLSAGLWLLEHKEQYRELADPTALWHDGKWYLYPSVDMAWVSADHGAPAASPVNIRDAGYAPRTSQQFLLMARTRALHLGLEVGAVHGSGAFSSARDRDARLHRPDVVLDEDTASFYRL